MKTLAFTLTLLAISRYLPIPFLPESIHVFFYEYGLIIQLISTGLLLAILIVKAAKKGPQWYFLILALPIVLLLFPKFFVDLGNQVTYSINDGRAPENLSNIILGTVLEQDSEGPTYHFNLGFYQRSELQYGEGIGKPYFDNMENELDMIFVDYYGDDWLWTIPD